MGYIEHDANGRRHRGLLADRPPASGLAKDVLKMTIEILYLTTQMQRWINLQVARHLEAQALKLKPRRAGVLFSADGPGGSVGLDRNGLPDGSSVADETESVDTIHA